MASVWYIGPSDTRSITAAQWLAAGVSGASDTVWNAANGWSINRSLFTAPQLTILDNDGKFNTNAADGPRPGSASVANAARFPNCPKYVPNPTYWGPPNSADAPVVTTGIAGDAAFNESYSCGVSTLPATWPVDAFGKMTVSGSNWAAKTYTNGVATSTTYRMMCDGSEVVFFAFSGNLFTMEIWVDGRPIVDNPINLGITAIYTPYGFTKLVFPSAKTRLIEVRTVAGLSGVYTKKPYRIWKPPADTNPKIAVQGDSYVAPTIMQDAASGGIGQGSYDLGIYQRMPRLLGTPSLVTDGVGGTGYLAGAGPGRPYTHAERIQWLRDVNPDVIVVHGGGANDVFNSFTNSQIIDAAAAHFRNLRKEFPDAKLIFVEGFGPPLFTPATYNPAYIAIRQGVQAALDIKGMYYVDIATTRPPIAGSGYVTAANTTGNSDIYVGSDQVHLSKKGNDFVGSVLAPKFKRILADDGRLDGTLVL